MSAMRLKGMDLYEIRDISKPISEHWGEDILPMIVAEECGELVQAVSKYYRNLYFTGNENPDLKQHIIEEMGDAFLTIMALTWSCKIDPDDIWKRIQYKAQLNKEQAV